MLLLASILLGCFGGDDAAPEEPDSVFDTLCPDGIARNVWYHFANGTDAVNSSSIFNGSDALVGDNIPLLFKMESVNSAIAGCSDLIHTAATVVVRSREPQRKIVDPSVIGTQNVISAVEKSGTIKRIVHTSSTAAIRPMDWKDGTVLTTETTSVKRLLGRMVVP